MFCPSSYGGFGRGGRDCRAITCCDNVWALDKECPAQHSSNNALHWLRTKHSAAPDSMSLPCTTKETYVQVGGTQRDHLRIGWEDGDEFCKQMGARVTTWSWNGNGPIRLEAIAIRLEAIAFRLEAIAFRFEAIAIRLETLAFRLEAIAIRLEAIAFRLEAMAFKLEAAAIRLEAIAIRLEASLLGWGPYGY